MRDLSEERISLPIIYSKESLPENDPVRNLLEGRRENTDDIIEAADIIIHSGAIHGAYEDACAHYRKAISSLKNFPENKNGRALEELSNFIVERRY